MFITHILCDNFITQHGCFFAKKYFKIQFCKADISNVYQKLDWHAYVYSYTYTYPFNFWYTLEKSRLSDIRKYNKI